MSNNSRKIIGAFFAFILLTTLVGCGAGSERDANAAQKPQLDGGRMGLSQDERIAKINSSNMSDADKQDRIAKIKAGTDGSTSK